ncbi:phage tail sheath C-terminal domain-containing protein [Tenacibaculum sp. 190524A05c]|uniref:Tail sheath protein C-terminal domain-containing protein n=1 Tax=Tenacibaculum platacis TaxID=3137852 RepID=A0ABP1EJI7_9FLAO
MSAYKTPGVYVEEIVKFPPSVAQVETAIPAFIGYTEKAKKKIDGDLANKPTRITSLLEYETYFGFARKETGITVTVTDTHVDGEQDRTLKVEAPTSPKPYLMYYAMQMYFANGGGPCYIVSVDTYVNDLGNENSISFDDLNDGLDKLRKEDEPTLIVFPDAKKLSEVDFYTLYNNALIQCNEMQDRFAIIDTHTSTDSVADALAARNRLNLEKDYLKYGAVYYPHLKTILDYRYDEESIEITHTTDLPSAIAEATAQLEAYKVDFAAENDLLRDTSDADLGYIGVAKKKITDDLDAADFTGETYATLKTRVSELSITVEKVIGSLNNLTSMAGLIEDSGNAAANSVKDEVGGADPIYTDITGQVTTINDIFVGTDKVNEVSEALQLALDNISKANSKAKLETQVNAISTELNKVYVHASTDVFTDAEGELDTLITNVKAGDSTDVNNGELNGRTLKSIENIYSQVYNEIKTEIGALPVELPPSSTMAGIYARVDSDRGVWKAPANVGTNYVLEPSLQISSDEQRDLNVDAVAGKSINAIRTFVGKGNLVWGARTLAGNDNEWRYVSVRRFFNMAEESIKKATEQFVFEPNDKNTWVRVKAMIDNFLTQQWRVGALAGPTPDKAFYVSVGLGETMTAQDILEGNMIIEIGMAVVRPAEFIILKFSHKMQEA